MNTVLRLISAAALLFNASAIHAQEERSRALFDSLSLSGGFFGFTMRYTDVLNSDVLHMGFSAGLVIKDHLNLGLAGSFATSTIKNNTYERYLNDSLAVNTQGGLVMNYGYGGVLVEPVLFHRSAVHLTVPVLVGAGGVGYSYPLPNSNGTNNNRVSGQAYFALEPGLEVEATIIGKFRIGVGASYLYTSDLTLPETEADALRRPMYRLTLKYAAP